MIEWIRREYEKDGYHIIVKAMPIEDYQKLPTADVEPVKHGYWTEKKFPGGGIWDYYFVCSECHHETPNGGYTIAPDYCPGCGAKMEEEVGGLNR